MCFQISRPLGRDVAEFVPSRGDVIGVGILEDGHDRIWQLAAPYLTVRDNDAHTPYSYGIAAALVALHPEADSEVVRPGIL